MIGPRPEPGRSPSVSLPLRYLAAAAAAFILATASVAVLAAELAGHYYQPRLVALAHTVGLAWITLAILGAGYQLIPIVLERPIWSERLARWLFVILVAGIVGVVGHFAIGRWAGLVWAAGMVGFGIVAHLVNVLLTIRDLRRWGFTACLVAGAYAGLGLTLVFGLVLASARAFDVGLRDALGSVHAHFHLALLGWVAPMVIGVATRVLPMFLLAPEPGGWSGRLQLGGLGLGVPAVVGGLLTWDSLVLPGALLVSAAVLGHVTWVAAMAWSRKRPVLDWGLRFVLTGVAFLPVGTALGLALAVGRLSGPRPALAYAVVALGGWASLTIVGMMLKIVPFLVWYRVCAPRVGRAPVPTLAELSWPHAEAVAYVLLTTGTVTLAAAVAAGDAAWIRVAGVVLALGAVTFGAALGRVLLHLAGRPGPDAARTPAKARTP